MIGNITLPRIAFATIITLWKKQLRRKRFFTGYSMLCCWDFTMQTISIWRSPIDWEATFKYSLWRWWDERFTQQSFNVKSVLNFQIFSFLHYKMFSARGQFLFSQRGTHIHRYQYTGTYRETPPKVSHLRRGIRLFAILPFSTAIRSYRSAYLPSPRLCRMRRSARIESWIGVAVHQQILCDARSGTFDLRWESPCLTFWLRWCSEMVDQP
jgi:hypothetical protein